MQVNVQSTGSLERRMEVSVPKEQIQQAIDERPGYRFYNLNIDAGSLWARRLIEQMVRAETPAHELRRLVRELGEAAWQLRKPTRRPLHEAFIRAMRRHPFRLAMADATKAGDWIDVPFRALKEHDGLRLDNVERCHRADLDARPRQGGARACPGRSRADPA